MELLLRIGTMLLLVVSAGFVGAEDESFDAAAKNAVIAEIVEKLDEHYVFPDKAKMMIGRLQQQVKDGAYDSIGEPAVFAAALTRDLRSISADLHLSVTHLEKPLGAGNGPDPEARREQLRRANFNFRKVEWLPGNIGYLRMDGFMSAGMAGRTAEAAMAFLANTDALIIDLRQNGGGSPTMVALLYSYFFKDSVHFNDFYVRKGDETQQFWTAEYVAGEKRPDIPIYILTSNRTFSAAEGFSYHLKHLQRATIVGEATRGGAHPTHSLPLRDKRFLISVPFGRAVNPVTGGNWEGTGVQPDVPVPASEALDKARMLALQELAEKEADPERHAELTWYMDALKAHLNPIEIETEALRAYTGQYGPRVISLESGGLVYQRDKGPRIKLHPMREDIFAIEEFDGFRVAFVRGPDGSVTGIKGLYANGTSDYFAKGPD